MSTKHAWSISANRNVLATPSSSFRVRPSTWATPQTVDLAGELDAGNAVRGLNDLRWALETGSGCLHLNMSAVAFIDASWIGVLVRSAKHAKTSGREVTVVHPSSTVRRLLELLGLSWLFDNSASTAA
jgi:anti-anti-sigma factor